MGELVFLPDYAADRIGELVGVDAVHDDSANGDHAIAAGPVGFEIDDPFHAVEVAATHPSLVVSAFENRTARQDQKYRGSGNGKAPFC